MTSRYILTLLLVLLLCSCNRRPAPLHPALQRAEQLMKEHPDSALAVLSHYNSRSFSDSADMAAYALLRTKAEDKNYIDHTNDSLIRIAVRYYDRRGSDFQKAESHYYWGRIFQNKRDDVHTAEQFIKASSWAQKLDNKEKLYQIQTNLAFLFWNNDIYDQADSLYTKVLEWHKRQKNYEGLAIVYSKLGSIAMENIKPNYKKAEYYLKIAYSLSKKIGNNYVKNEVVSSLIYLYVNTNQPLTALKLSKESEELLINNYHIYDTYLAKGCAYQQIGQNDSAKKYLSLSLTSAYNLTRAEAYKHLREIAEKEKDKSLALSYSNKYNIYHDSIDNSRQSNQVITAIKNLLNRETELIHKTKETRLKYILYITVALIAILLLLFNRKRKYINILLDDLDETITDHNLSIATLENTIKQKDIVIKKLSIFKQEHTEVSKKQSKINSDSHPFETLRQHFGKYPIYNTIIKAISENKKLIFPKELLNDTDWKMFEEDVSNMLPYLIKELHSEKYSLNEKNIRFCCLLFIGFNFTEIAYIFGCTPQAINKRKNKIFKKMEVNSLDELENLINNSRN